MKIDISQIMTSPNTIYICGPMTGYPDKNIPAFAKVAKHFRELGFDVINPGELEAQLSLDLSWSDFLRLDLSYLLKCGAIALLPGWEKSKGARLEKHVAQELDMTIFYTEDIKELWTQ